MPAAVGRATDVPTHTPRRDFHGKRSAALDARTRRRCFRRNLALIRLQTPLKPLPGGFVFQNEPTEKPLSSAAQLIVNQLHKCLFLLANRWVRFAEWHV